MKTTTNHVAQNMPFILGITGPSGSGKSSLVDNLAHRWSPRRVCVLSMDRYYKDLKSMSMEERNEVNFDIPSALDLERMAVDLRQLSKGIETEVPVYDFALHQRQQTSELLTPESLIIVEGLFCLHYNEIHSLLDYSVFLNLPIEQCLERRLQRDTIQRGRSAESIVQQFNRHVRDSTEQFLLPQAEKADLVLDANQPQNQLVEQVLQHILTRIKLRQQDH